MRLALKGFIPWLEENHSDEMIPVHAPMDHICDLHDDLCQETFDHLL